MGISPADEDSGKLMTAARAAVNASDAEPDDSLSEADLSAMTIAQIKALAAERGYTITASKKADIIAEFLEQQNA